jgi:hypothetical protein
VSQLVGLPTKVAVVVPMLLLLTLSTVVVITLGMLLIGLVVFGKDDRRCRRRRQIIRTIGAAVADACRPAPELGLDGVGWRLGRLDRTSLVVLNPGTAGGGGTGYPVETQSPAGRDPREPLPVGATPPSPHRRRVGEAR